MHTSAQFLLTVGGILLLGLLTSAIGQRTFLPRVTLLLLFGILIGEQALNIIPSMIVDLFEIIADIALLMVGFLLGGRLQLSELKKNWNRVFWMSFSAAMIAAVLVAAGLMLAGMEPALAVLLGCIASATAPAATLDVVQESGSHNPFQELLLAIVAIDDAWALILFALGTSFAATLNGSAEDSSAFLLIVHDIGGAVLLGAALGAPAVYLTGRVKKGQPILSEALGLVFICGGLAKYFDVSYLITSMVMGAVVVNFARHHDYPFHAIEGIEWPFMVIFFVLAGASLDLPALADVGFVGLIYIFCRVAGKLLGAYAGACVSDASVDAKKWMGIALLPQAGVPIGMALVASSHFPAYKDVLLSVIIGTTVFFEILGPVFTRIAIKQASRTG